MCTIKSLLALLRLVYDGAYYKNERARSPIMQSRIKKKAIHVSNELISICYSTFNFLRMKEQICYCQNEVHIIQIHASKSTEYVKALRGHFVVNIFYIEFSLAWYVKAYIYFVCVCVCKLYNNNL